MPVVGKIQIYGGDFQSFEGTPLALGTLVVQLSHDAQELVNPGLLTGAPKITIALDNTGNIPLSANVMIWPNDQLYTGGGSTYYTVWGYDSTGVFVYGPQFWVLISAVSPYNIAGQIPSNPPGSGLLAVSPAVLLNPTSDQTISAFNLLPAAGNTTQSLGFQGALWNANLRNVAIAGTLADHNGFQGFQGEVLQSTGVGTQWGPAGSGPQGPQGPQGFQGFQGPANSGSIAFGSITSGSNTSAAMTVGSGASMTTSGTGTINANKLEGVTISGTPSTGQTLVATSSSAADWATGFLNLPANGLRLEYGGATGTTTVTFSPAFSGTPSVLLSTGPGTGTTQLNTTSSTQFTTISSDGSPFTWLAIGPA